MFIYLTKTPKFKHIHRYITSCFASNSQRELSDKRKGPDKFLPPRPLSFHTWSFVWPSSSILDNVCVHKHSVTHRYKSKARSYVASLTAYLYTFLPFYDKTSVKAIHYFNMLILFKRKCIYIYVAYICIPSGNQTLNYHI